ncbi:MAG: serine hydrolase [Saprospiraceae bacterium]
MKKYPLQKSILIFIILLPFISTSQHVYYPGEWGDWEKKSPTEVGMNDKAIADAIKYAQEHESESLRNLEHAHYQGGFGREPFGDAIGPHKTRGDQTGIIIKDGYIIAEWGEPFSVDMTMSVTKSLLSSTLGVAYDQGLIKDIHDPVRNYMGPVLFAETSRGSNKADYLQDDKVHDLFKTEHNRKITWNHLLRQTSDWEGSLFGKPDWADRPSGDSKDWIKRPRNEPGSVFEYNDTRVNLLALAATNLWRKPLPKVLKEYIMDPIGASPTWRWQGYENSWIVIDGEYMQVVSGGGHWGGGMMLSARDQARFGYLTLRRGKWKNKQILSDEWVSMALTPTTANDGYGFMNWFLNSGEKPRIPSAPKSSFYHLGAGTNMVYVDPENDLVIVARWIKGKAMDGVVKRVLEGIK